MSNGYQSDEDLLADSADAERNRSFEGEDWGELIASGRMDIEDTWSLTAREQEEYNAAAERRLIEYAKTPEQKAEDQLKKILEQNRRRYVATGCEDNYTPTAEDKVKREVRLESDRNPQFVPF
jgi:nucleoid-associated protein YgaU